MSCNFHLRVAGYFQPQLALTIYVTKVLKSLHRVTTWLPPDVVMTHPCIVVGAGSLSKLCSSFASRNTVKTWFHLHCTTEPWCQGEPGAKTPLWLIFAEQMGSLTVAFFVSPQNSSEQKKPGPVCSFYTLSFLVCLLQGQSASPCCGRPHSQSRFTAPSERSEFCGKLLWICPWGVP